MRIKQWNPEPIIAKRKQNGLSKAKVARSLNIPYTTYDGYENNRRTPDFSTVLKISSLMQIPLNELIGDEAAAQWVFDSVTGDSCSNESPVIPSVQAVDQRIAASLMKLNELGQEEAARRVEELTEISRYKNPDYDEQDSP